MHIIEHRKCKLCDEKIVLGNESWLHLNTKNHAAIPARIFPYNLNKDNIPKPTDAKYVRTVSLRKVYFMNPHPDDIVIEDIAYHLAGKTRFSGGLRPRITIAEHLINCHTIGLSMEVSKAFLRVLLLHDAEEYIMEDLAAPIKHLCHDYMLLGNNLLKIIGQKFNANFDYFNAELKEIDYKMCRTENHYLRNNPKEDIYENFRFPIYNAEDAERTFLERYYASC